MVHTVCTCIVSQSLKSVFPIWLHVPSIGKLRRWVSYILTKLDTIFSFSQLPSPGPLSCSANPWPCVCTSDALGDKYGTWSTYLRWNPEKTRFGLEVKRPHAKKSLEKKEFKNPPFWNEISMASNCSINPNIAALLRESHQTWSDICTVGSSQNGENLLIVECLQGGAHGFWHWQLPSLKLTASKATPGNGWLEFSIPFLLGKPYVQGSNR